MTKEITLAPVLGTLTATGWQAPQDDLTQAQWVKCGEQLTRVEGAASWWLGDWWAYGEKRKYGDGEELAEKIGVNYDTARTFASVSRAFELSIRIDNLSFNHHRIIMAVKDSEQRVKWLAKAEKNEWTIRELRGELLKLKRVRRHEALTQPNFDQRFSLIYCDPPWKFEMHSDLGGEDRAAAENHYDTMTIEQICALAMGGRSMSEVADDACALFLWTTAPMLKRSFEVIEAWGFEYKTFAVWDKEVAGTGYIFRNQHEPLIYASRGDMPAPMVALPSVFRSKRGKHSAKPVEVREALEKMYPKFGKDQRLEMFARGKIDGWSVWGNEAEGE